MGRHPSTNPGELTLAERIVHLERRLDLGWQKISDAEAQGIDTTEWTNFWISLLREYEEAYRQYWGLPSLDKGLSV